MADQKIVTVHHAALCQAVEMALSAKLQKE